MSETELSEDLLPLNIQNEEVISDWQFLLDCLAKTLKTDELEQFTKLSNVDKIKFCYSNDVIHETLRSFIENCADKSTFNKSAEVSKLYRLKGNEIYAGPNPLKALDFYTKSIFYAPKQSEELALSLGNRSAVLILQDNYWECIADIERSLKLSSDDQVRKAKLLVRKGRALISCRQQKEGLKVLKEANDVLNNNAKIARNRGVRKIRREMDYLINQPKRLDIVPRHDPYDVDNFLDANYLFKTNPEFVDASQLLDLKEAEGKGRHVIAQEDIAIGDVLFIEEPFAFVVLPDPSHSHCHNCCSKIINPIPCDECAEGCYCCDTCKDKAWESHHYLECGLGLDLCYHIGIAHLGLRVATVGLTTPDKEKYERVKQLVDHIDIMKPEDIFIYSLTATLLVLYLEGYTELLIESPDRNELLMDFGALILQHIANLISNGHAILESKSVITFEKGVEIYEQKRIGTGIFPASSMMNHSCDPSIIASFYKTSLIVKSMKNIPKGSEVFNCYGPHFRRMKKEERKEILKSQYQFDCDCEHCTADYEFMEKFTGLICACCSAKVDPDTFICTFCKKDFPKMKKNIEEAEEVYENAQLHLEEKEFPEALNCYMEYVKLKERYSYRYNVQIMECNDYIARVQCLLGNHTKSFQLTEDGLPGIRERFGKFSIELALEIVKLSDVMIALMYKTGKMHRDLRPMMDTCLFHCEEALEILKLLYGVCSEKYTNLKKNIFLLRTY